MLIRSMNSELTSTDEPPFPSHGTLGVCSWLLGHLALGVLISLDGRLATLHGALLVVSVAGLIIYNRSAVLSVAAIAYVASFDVIWRMSGAAMPWEAGKYCVLIFSILLAFRSGKIGRTLVPFLYVAVIVLSVPLALTTVEAPGFKFFGTIRFNMIGPLSLCACAIAFGGQVISSRSLNYILLTMIGPVLVVSGVVFVGVLTGPEIRFISESNFDMSGGFGPNQVASSLGLGALIALILFQINCVSRGAEFALLSVFFVLVTQTILTFSRGGIYLAAISGFVSVALLALNPVYLIRSVLVGFVGLLVSMFFLVPFLMSFTDGMVSVRFGDSTPATRVDVVRNELSVFVEHPFFGVGVGASRYLGENANFVQMNHTEYIRVIIEHGLVGFVIFTLVLGRAVVKSILVGELVSRAILLALVTWSLFYFLIYGFRTAIPAVLIALGYLSVRGPYVAMGQSLGTTNIK